MQRTVAVVDDNELTRVLAGDALGELGYAAVLFDSCESALAAFAREVPAACLVDQVLPGMTGEELVRALRASSDPRLRALPVIAFTSSSEAKLVDAGADAVVRKPFRLPALEAALRRALAAAELPSRAVAAPPSPAPAALPRPPARPPPAGDPATTRGWGRRAAIRVAASLPVTLERGTWSSHGVTSDLSAGGFSTLVNVGLAPGDEVQFALTANRRIIRGRARVAGATAAGAGRDRLGLALLEVAPQDREALAALVREALRARGETEPR